MSVPTPTTPLGGAPVGGRCAVRRCPPSGRSGCTLTSSVRTAPSGRSCWTSAWTCSHKSCGIPVGTSTCPSRWRRSHWAAESVGWYWSGTSESQFSRVVEDQFPGLFHSLESPETCILRSSLEIKCLLKKTFHKGRGGWGALGEVHKN